MNVKTAELKNNLSRYLRRVRAGKTLTVFDRDTAIAVLSPVPASPDIAPPLDRAWQRERLAALARAKKHGVKIDIPLHRPVGPAFPDIKPILAPDGRTDINTIDLVRGGRDW
jgi:antitoxin (DNA-binding transcriptional repressor) of toxin-antitoxin stability system